MTPIRLPKLIPRKPSRTAIVALCVLLLVDSLLILAHLWQTRGVPPAWAEGLGLSLEQDGGLGESVNYVKLAIGGGLLAALALRDKAAVLGAWAVTLAAIVADDALQLHERGGQALGSELVLPTLSWLPREQDMGELIVWGAMAAILLPLVVLTHRKSDSAAALTSSRLAALLAALVFFAVVVDVLHIAFVFDSVGLWLGLVEDGGEILVSSLILVVVIVAATDAGARSSSVPSADAGC